MNHDHREHSHDHHDPRATTVELARTGAVPDPVSGMTVNPDTAAGSVTHDGKPYYFCSTHCLTQFKADPARYTGSGPASEGHSRRNGAEAVGSHQPLPPPNEGSVKYTCPMHPEVIQDGPGNCPKCGMALEPLVPQAGKEDNSELRDMTRRFRVATSLTLPVFILAMAPMIPGIKFPHWLTQAGNWVGLALATPVVLWAGWPFFVRAAQALSRRTA